MSKTTSPPSPETLKNYGVRFVPTNCFAPNFYTVKHKVFPFNGFDTYSEGLALREASLVNSIANYLSYTGKGKEGLDQTIAAVLRMVGSDSGHSKLL